MTDESKNYRAWMDTLAALDKVEAENCSLRAAILKAQERLGGPVYGVEEDVAYILQKALAGDSK